MHRYFLGRNPETAGWGPTSSCGVYGNLQWQLCEERINSGQKPILTTETGYNSKTEVDETTQAKYLSRAILLSLEAGLPQTYLYNLKDYAPSDGFGGNGLIRLDDSTKPAFAAVQSLIAYFSDPGSAGQAPPLSFSTDNSAIHTVLFARRDGSYVLALWYAGPSWNPISIQPISVKPMRLNVTLAPPATAAAAKSLNDAGVFVPAAFSMSAKSVSLAVDDHITVLSISTHASATRSDR